MKVFNSIIEWLGKDPVFPWFEGDGLTFVLCCLILGGMIAICISKKLRNKFF